MSGAYMSNKLNAKQDMFCLEYIKDFNATQAAIRAGYSKKTAGSQAHDLLKKPEIQEKLAEAIKERSEKTKIDAQWVLTQAVKVHERCMQSEPVMVNGEPTGEYKFEHAGANKALEIIGKHVDVQAFLDKSKVEHALSDDFDSLMGDASSDE